MQPKWKIWKGNYSPFFYLGILYLFLHITLPHINDDRVLEEGMEFTQLSLKYIYYIMTSKYQEWSSRIFINTLTLIMGTLPHFIWIIIDTGMIVLAAFSIGKIIGCLSSKRMNIFIVCMVMIYPIHHMSTAGWKATTITYMWSLALGIFAMISIGKWYREETISKKEAFLYLLAILYGSNQEQMAAILMVVFGLTLIYSIWKKRLSIIINLQFLISLVSFLMAAFSPGNVQRIVEETEIWFADYHRLTLFQKFDIGISSAGYHIFYETNWCFLIMSGFMVLLLLSKQDSNHHPIYKVMGCIPFITALVMGPLYSMFHEGIIGMQALKQALTIHGTITTENYTKFSSYMPLLFICLLLGMILTAFYMIYENTIQTIWMSCIFLAGFASRAVLAFSPTVWASSTRTYLYLYFSMIVISVILYREWIDQITFLDSERIKYTKIAETFIKILAAISFVCAL